MKKTFFLAVLAAFLLLAPPAWGQLAEIKTDPRQTLLQVNQQEVQKPQSQTQSGNATQSQPNIKSPSTNDQLQRKVNSLERQLNSYMADQRTSNWLVWWWQIGFWTGILWLAVWVFVGWQWTRYKFWGFGWPWPWWFWIPVVWFIPWFLIGWWWWLNWWVWWVWIWWIFPWIFWAFWWIILFKESIIWFWRKGKL